MFIVFVFFKQKTAYEMRISDWSSDVCSSDLLEINFRLVGEGFRGGAQHAFPGKASPALGKHEQIKRSGGIGVAGIKIPGGVFYISLKIRRKQQGCQHAGEGSGVHHRRIGNPEIGRESCRERVWQYV